MERYSQTISPPVYDQVVYRDLWNTIHGASGHQCMTKLSTEIYRTPFREHQATSAWPNCLQRSVEHHSRSIRPPVHDQVVYTEIWNVIRRALGHQCMAKLSIQIYWTPFVEHQATSAWPTCLYRSMEHHSVIHRALGHQCMSNLST